MSKTTAVANGLKADVELKFTKATNMKCSVPIFLNFGVENYSTWRAGKVELVFAPIL